MISIPEYVARFINPELDLNETPKINCLFHKEDTPSMSYSQDLKVLTCFGSCHKTWKSAEALHKHRFKFKTLEEASMDLANRLGKEYVKTPTKIDHEKIEERQVIIRIKEKAKSDNQLLIDYMQVLSEFPVDVEKLKELLK